MGHKIAKRCVWCGEHLDYQNYHDAYQQIGRFLEEVYIHKRIHSSLGYLTPAEFEAQWLAEQAALVRIP
jgi:hypothetical protein